MLWLYIHFPQLQLDTLYLGGEAAQATVIVNTLDNCVVQCNEQAKTQGITIGHSLGSAASLCPNLRVISYSGEIESQQLEHIAQASYQHIADIALMPPKGLLLRITPMLALYQNVSRCWQAIKPCIEQITTHYSVATAYSAMAAQCLAQQQVINHQTCHKPIVQLPTDTDIIDQQLASVALSTTPLANKAVLKLSHIGITHLGDLLKIPLKELAQRFDIEVVNTLGKIKGELRTALEFYQPSAQFRYYLDLNFEIQTTRRLAKPIEHLLAKLEAYLIMRELIANQLQLKLVLRDSAPQFIEINSAQGEQQLNKLLELTALKLERVKLTAPVVALELTSVLLVEKQTTSGDIFEPKKVGSNQLTSPQLISLLQAKLGEARVQAISHHLEHAPESANQQHLISMEQQRSTDLTMIPPLLRPSYLLASPKPWREPVTIIHGPERIQTQWWQQQTIERDYYIARNQQQQWCWLFKQANGKWFIHGYFG